jgi:hypothetical protein
VKNLILIRRVEVAVGEEHQQWWRVRLDIRRIFVGEIIDRLPIRSWDPDINPSFC